MITKQRVAQTLVSCLYDLGKRGAAGRGIDFYVKHAAMALQLDLPLVIFVDPELAQWVRDTRARYGLNACTRVIERPLEDLPVARLLPSLAGFRTFANGDAAKDTPHHQVVEWSKFDLVEEVIAANPFGTDHFAWIDAGIGHVAAPSTQFPAATTRVSVLQMCAVAPQETADRMAFFGHERGRIAGGLLRARRDAFGELIGEFRCELASALAQRFRPNEQMILSYLTVTQPDLFEFYYGDYASILCNWDAVRRDVDTVFLNIAHCRRHGLWDAGRAACAAIDAALASEVLVLDADRRAKLLDEHYIAAWHAGEHDVARELRDRLLRDCAQTDYFASHRQRILGNFARY